MPKWIKVGPPTRAGEFARALKCFIGSLPNRDTCLDNDEFQDAIERARISSLRKRAKGARLDATRFAAMCHVLADLAKQGWEFRVARTGILGRPANTGLDESSPSAVRDARRAQYIAQRNEQLRQPAVRRFVSEMESIRIIGDGPVSILSLLRDGRELASQLRSGGTSTAALSAAIKPYLQFVTDSNLCASTGLRLNDIWRYFRHTWANPYQSIPGRTMTVLVRDAAMPAHPVIGIAAISSAAVKLKARDLFIGWEPELVVEQLRQQPTKRALSWLLLSLDSLLAEVFQLDLIADDVITAQDLTVPSTAAIGRLERVARECRALHQRLMQSADYKRPFERTDDTGDGFWEEQARTPLFRSKRAGELAVLLRIRQLVAKHLDTSNTISAFRSLLATSSGRHAISQLVWRLRARRVGTAIADLTVCGALPPYNAVLGGKLVAMLMASPEVVVEYRRRYRDAQSVIASSMAGRSVVRAADLVFIGTTSLYGTRPCQYDRIAIEASTVGGPAGEVIRYKFLERTEGWGTFHFGDNATRALAAFVRSQRNGVQVNHVFGEGASPKLRALRDGLNLLGFHQEQLLNHGLEKSIYGVSLVSNLRDYLLGLDRAPRYLMNCKKPLAASNSIVAWWMDRWVKKRLARPECFDEMCQHTLVHPITHGGRVVLPDADPCQLGLFD